ncbi:MAG: LytTR family DNA-binding domain-containing protein [Clostridiales bacterium]|nr:LytTR family DNA-binding domain-containing protein [Clostridiales bacterium]
MNGNRTKEVENITKQLYRDYCHGDSKLWFDVLYKDCVWVGPGEPTLIGADKIKDYFSNYPLTTQAEVINESYSTIKLNNTSYIVTGNVLVGVDTATPTATVLMTMVYRYIGDSPKLTYQHMSYDFINADLSNIYTTSKSNSSTPYHSLTDLATRLLIRQTLLTKDHIPPISVKVGQQIYYISPASIIYLQSNGHKTSIYCIDKVLECSMLITDIAPLLPDRFYFLRRGCIVNTMYITAIRRCEVELVFGTTIQVPAATFTKIKKELNALINRIGG